VIYYERVILIDDVDAHRASRTRDNARSHFRIGRIEVRLLRLDDFENRFLVTVPTLSRFGTPDPFAKPAAFLRRTAAGGDFRIKLNDLSW
jgi:hypothetical protein